MEQTVNSTPALMEDQSILFPSIVANQQGECFFAYIRCRFVASQSVAVNSAVLLTGSSDSTISILTFYFKIERMRKLCFGSSFAFKQREVYWRLPVRKVNGQAVVLQRIGLRPVKPRGDDLKALRNPDRQFPLAAKPTSRERLGKPSRLLG